MSVIDRLVKYYKSVGWWASELKEQSWPDMIAVKGKACVFLSYVNPDRERPIMDSIGKEQAEYLSKEKAITLQLVSEDGDAVRVFRLTWDEQSRLASGIRLRDLCEKPIRVSLNAGS